MLTFEEFRKTMNKTVQSDDEVSWHDLNLIIGACGQIRFASKYDKENKTLTVVIPYR